MERLLRHHVLGAALFLSLGMIPSSPQAHVYETSTPTVTLENGVVVVRGARTVKRLPPVESLPRTQFKVTNKLGPAETLPRTRLPRETLMKTRAAPSRLKGSSAMKSSVTGSNLFRSRYQTHVNPYLRYAFPTKRHPSTY